MADNNQPQVPQAPAAGVPGPAPAPGPVPGPAPAPDPAPGPAVVEQPDDLEVISVKLIFEILICQT